MSAVHIPYRAPKRVALYCRKRAREAQDYYARQRWLDLFHKAMEDNR